MSRGTVREHFKVAWDKATAEAHGEDRAKLFADIIQNVIEELQAGKTTALSYFMHNETKRVLVDVPTLVLPGSFHPW